MIFLILEFEIPRICERAICMETLLLVPHQRRHSLSQRLFAFATRSTYYIRRCWFLIIDVTNDLLYDFNRMLQLDRKTLSMRVFFMK